MMRQWAEIKRAYPDCIVLFRLGDFYEAFNEDAGRVADICDVTLTSRPVSKGERAPMAGVPYHAVDAYIAQLVRAGQKVAIVEQTGRGDGGEKRARMSPRETVTGEVTEPTAAGGSSLMSREVVRVVTAGTLVEGDLLDARTNNFLAAVVPAGGGIGLAYADVTTGEFHATQLADDGAYRRLLDELVRLRPAEILVPEGVRRGGADWAADLRQRVEDLGLATTISPYPSWRFDADNARHALLEHFHAASLGAYGCADLPLAVSAAGAVIAYVRDTQQGNVAQVTGLSTYSTDAYMVLDAATRRNLELTTTIRGDTRRGTLLSVIDDTRTAMGGRRLRAWLDRPLVDRATIERRLDAVDALVAAGRLRAELRAGLGGIPDLERLTNRIVAGYAGPREALALARGLKAVPRLRSLQSTLDTAPEALAALLADDVDDIADAIVAALPEDPPATLGAPGVIRAGYSPDLDAIHASVSAARTWIAELETHERERTGIRKLRVGYNRVFGYYLSVPKASAGDVPPDYHRKQTTVDGERYVTPDLKARESEVLNAEERIVALERELFSALVATVTAAADRLLRAARDLAELDAYVSLAEVAVRQAYTRPVLEDGCDLVIQGGRHPVVERARPAEFVPNDLTIAAGEIVLLTGPNMAGKSTVGRQAAIIALMAQIGSFVPAERARLGIVDRVFTRIGAQDELAAGQSTFMVEMVETAGILHHATPRSLIVLDELGRGTSTYDGMAIAWAVIERIHDDPRLGARTLFATHYHELTALADLLPRVRNYSMAVTETPDGVVFLHRVVPGAADRSYGIHVAELAGLPRSVTDRAWAILGRLEAEGNVPLQGAAGRPTASGGQLPLFAPVEREHPVLAMLRALDPDTLSPLEALTRLYELRRAAGS
jgi:DNA mismatch repair protein MutS